MDLGAHVGEIAAQCSEVAQIAVGLLEDLKDVGERAAELATEPAGLPVALRERGEVPEDVGEAQLALGVVDVEVDRVAIRNDRPARLLAQQRDRSIAVAPRGDLKQRGLLCPRRVDKRGSRRPTKRLSGR
jgi:hypothetical protein